MNVNIEECGHKTISHISVEFKIEYLKRKEELSIKEHLIELAKGGKNTFGKNNLILLPKGSDKLELIENILIPKRFKGNVLYLLLDNDSELEDSLLLKSSKICKESLKSFSTLNNQERFIDESYNIHVMTYSEFGNKVRPPHQTFTDNFDLIFCDKIDSLAGSFIDGNHLESGMALSWVLLEHDVKKVYCFASTKDKIEELERKTPGYFNNIRIFNYLKEI